MEFIEEARDRRPILGTQTSFWSLTRSVSVWGGGWGGSPRSNGLLKGHCPLPHAITPAAQCALAAGPGRRRPHGPWAHGVGGRPRTPQRHGPERCH